MGWSRYVCKVDKSKKTGSDRKKKILSGRINTYFKEDGRGLNTGNGESRNRETVCEFNLWNTLQSDCYFLLLL
jgi:hypothetical protein